MPNGAVQIASVSEDIAQGIVSVGEPRLNLQGLAQVIDRFFGRTLSSEKNSKIGLGFHERGINLHGSAEFTDRLVQGAAFSENQTQIVVGKARLFINRERMPPERIGVFPDMGLVPTQCAQPYQEE